MLLVWVSRRKRGRRRRRRSRRFALYSRWPPRRTAKRKRAQALSWPPRSSTSITWWCRWTRRHLSRLWRAVPYRRGGSPFSTRTRSRPSLHASRLRLRPLSNRGAVVASTGSKLRSVSGRRSRHRSRRRASLRLRLRRRSHGRGTRSEPSTPADAGNAATGSMPATRSSGFRVSAASTRSARIIRQGVRRRALTRSTSCNEPSRERAKRARRSARKLPRLEVLPEPGSFDYRRTTW